MNTEVTKGSVYYILYEVLAFSFIKMEMVGDAKEVSSEDFFYNNVIPFFDSPTSQKPSFDEAVEQFFGVREGDRFFKKEEDMFEKMREDEEFFFNKQEKSTVLNDSVTVTQRSRMCNCHDVYCGCCYSVKLFGKEKFKGCMEMEYVSRDFAIFITFSINGHIIITRVLSGRNPLPFCTSTRYVPLVSFCIRLYDIHHNPHGLSLCMRLEATSMRRILFSIRQEGFPHTIQQLSPQLNRQLMADFTGERSGFVRVGQDGWLLPARYEPQALGYYTLPLRHDDVWIQTFPRSGTTWCQEMVWLINNDFDYETAKRIPLDTRFPFLEFGILHHPQLHEEVLALNNHQSAVAEVLKRWRTPGAELAKNLPSPRHFKTHLPLPLLPPQLLDTCKVVYVARNPVDVTVSYFHHNRYLAVHGYTGDFQKYWHYFQDDLLVYSPYWEHVKQAWAKRNHHNFLFMFYEDLIKDLSKNILIISDFLDKEVSEEQLSKLIDHLQIDNFRNNVPLHPDVEIKGMTREHEQGFIRKGKVKGNNEFTEELEAEVNKWVNENLAGTDLRFPMK